MSNTFSTLTSKQLRRAATIRERIDKLEKQLAATLDLPAERVVTAQAQKPKRRYSRAARATMAAAAKKRWAKARGGGKPAVAVTKVAKKAKRKLGAAARAKIAERMKARWAKVKAAGKKSL